MKHGDRCEFRSWTGVWYPGTVDSTFLHDRKVRVRPDNWAGTLTLHHSDVRPLAHST